MGVNWVMSFEERELAISEKKPTSISKCSSHGGCNRKKRSECSMNTALSGPRIRVKRRNTQIATLPLQLCGGMHYLNIFNSMG